MNPVEPPRDVIASLATGDDAVTTAPRIVNGLTVRPRKKLNLWPYGFLLLPDFAVPLVIAGFGMRWLLQYLDANRPKES